VIPAPDKLTFGTATVLSAGCCIPAILSMISMWFKILKTEWKARSRAGDDSQPTDGPIEGTNGATISGMKDINSVIRGYLRAFNVPVFVAAILAILIMGERNFFSSQVYYMTEPMATIGR
jgi:hypothetical protein